MCVKNIKPLIALFALLVMNGLPTAYGQVTDPSQSLIAFLDLAKNHYSGNDLNDFINDYAAIGDQIDKAQLPTVLNSELKVLWMSNGKQSVCQATAYVTSLCYDTLNQIEETVKSYRTPDPRDTEIAELMKQVTDLTQQNVVLTQQNTALQNMQRDPRVCLSPSDPRYPYSPQFGSGIPPLSSAALQ
jgi:hypothetical protein